MNNSMIFYEFFVNMNSIDKTKPRWYYIVNPKENKISNQKRFNIRYDQKN